MCALALFIDARLQLKIQTWIWFQESAKWKICGLIEVLNESHAMHLK